MRRFIQEYMGNSIYYMIDDDIKGLIFQNEKILLTLSQGLKLIELFVEDSKIDFSYIGFTSCESRTRFNSNKYLYVSGNPICCNLYNGKILNEYNIKFTGDSSINEDVEICLNSFKQGFPPKKIEWGSYSFYIPQYSKKSIASSEDKVNNYICNNYIKFGNWIRIKSSKSIPLYTSINWNNVKSLKKVEYDNILLDYCKNKDINNIKEYIKPK